MIVGQASRSIWKGIENAGMISPKEMWNWLYIFLEIIKLNFRKAVQEGSLDLTLKYYLAS